MKNKELAIYNKESKEIVSLGLTTDLVDHFMYRKGNIKKKHLSVIESPSRDKIKVVGGAVFFRKGNDPKLLGLNY